MKQILNAKRNTIGIGMKQILNAKRNTIGIGMKQILNVKEKMCEDGNYKLSMV